MKTPKAEITVVAERPNMIQECEEGDKDNAWCICALYIHFSSSRSVDQVLVAGLGSWVGLGFFPLSDARL